MGLLNAIHGLPRASELPKQGFRGSVVSLCRWLAKRALLIALITAGVVAISFEMRTSWVQSLLSAALGARLTYEVASGPSESIRFPAPGPYDLQRGYSDIPIFSERLQARGYAIEQQARDSYASLLLGRVGIYPIYHEKNQAGIQILDRQGGNLYSFRDPWRIYPTFESIPPIAVRTLLFIENRHLLDDGRPNENPAIEWDRLGRAMFDFTVHAVDRQHSLTGGSTLATQLEKLRHSPEGRTHSAHEKLRQITSATLRSYQDGPRTLEARKEVIRDYINSIPLAATPAEGEIHGLGDGLAAWYGADVHRVNDLLNANEDALNDQQMSERGRAYRQVLSLFLGLRRPSHYLGLQAPDALPAETDRYLNALSKAGVISARLRDAAMHGRSDLRRAAPRVPSDDFVSNKATNAIRMELLNLLGVDQTYSLDRFDLQAETTIDQKMQQAVTGHFQEITDGQRPPTLNEERLLAVGDPRKVIYSFTLYERGPGVNLLRVKTDTFNQPLSIVDGSRLQLGSTAKLRTLINYLQIIEALHAELIGWTDEQLSTTQVPVSDRLTEWALEYMVTTDDRSLPAMLNAALERKYSGSPGELFFTAGGLHVFANFESSENSRMMTVHEAFEQSVNLVFIRLMRDIENYYKWRLPGVSPAILEDENHPARDRYLKRFADQEGTVFLKRFYDRYQGLSTDDALEKLMQGIRPSPVRVAVIYRFIRPNADFDTFSKFMTDHIPKPLWGKRTPEKLYEDYAPGKFNLADCGYLAGIHPLELWMLEYMQRNPKADFSEIVARSVQQRQEVYKWLFRPKMRHGQDLRIGILLEQDAFREIWKAWSRIGYPFDSLTPSYATAIGVSGDTPRALAELAGIIANGGIRYSTEVIPRMRFAQNTPMETSFKFQGRPGDAVLSPAVASIVYEQMLGVVGEGTGRRVNRALSLPNGQIVPIAGKTGTGDNRFKVWGKGSGLIAERPVNRTAAFVFIIGDRFFGTVMAFVPGQNASSYRFTSALAVQVLKDLLPTLRPLLGSAPNPLNQAKPAPAGK